MHADPHGFVSLACLSEFFSQVNDGCPKCDHAKFVSCEFRVKGAVFKADLRCERKHSYNWYDILTMRLILTARCSSVATTKSTLVNELIPVATAMSGITVTAMKTFLNVLSVQSFSDTRMRENSVLLEEVSCLFSNRSLIG